MNHSEWARNRAAEVRNRFNNHPQMQVEDWDHVEQRILIAIEEAIKLGLLQASNEPVQGPFIPDDLPYGGKRPYMRKINKKKQSAGDLADKKGGQMRLIGMKMTSVAKAESNEVARGKD